MFVHHAIGLFNDDSQREWEKFIRASQDPPSLVKLRSFFEEYLQTLMVLQKKVMQTEEKATPLFLEKVCIMVVRDGINDPRV